MFGPSKQSLSLLVQGLISFSAQGLIGGAVRILDRQLLEGGLKQRNKVFGILWQAKIRVAPTYCR